MKAAILELCQEGPYTARQIAASLGLRLNTVRSYYIYRMMRDGDLKAERITEPPKRGWTTVYRTK